MGKKISVSIIVPVYNSEKYLSELLNDIIGQSFTDFEVIVVNDGSMDNSQHIIEDYAKRDKRIRPIEIRSSGVSEARNVGISLAKGKYIRFVDADDRLPVDSISNMMEVVKQNEGIDLIIGSFSSVPEANLYYGEHALIGKQTLEQMSMDLLFNIQSFYYGVVWNKLYKREMIEKYNIRFCKDISWGEDYFFNLEYYKHCQWIYIIPVNKKIYSYYQHPTSITKTVHKLPEEKINEICVMRTEQTKKFFDSMGLGDKLELEWKFAFLFSNLFEIARGKDSCLHEKYQKIKNSLSQEGVQEYIELKKDYFSDVAFYRFTYFCTKKKWYVPLFIYVSICGWFANHFNWVKYIWMKIGGKRPKIL